STLTSNDNEFYQYMVYHCVKGSYYFSDLVTGTYPVISAENNISITITNDYKLNMDPLNITDYTGFIFSESNYPTKNGALHTVDGLFEAPEPEPVYVMFNAFDHLEIISGDWYLNYFKKWDDTKDENGRSIYFENIVYQGDYLQYYWKGNSNPGWIKGDYSTGYAGNRGALNMMGYWWLEVTTPKVMKGTYNMKLAMSVTGNAFSLYVDGKKTHILDYSRPMLTNTLEFKETETHTVKIVSLYFATLFWRDIQFVPVN
ncbi:MAG: hypothetical protein QNK33_03775, partial [Bacteroidales bacterium]|nr:hypothetical protein [Bacteroidales bacterium]